MPNIKVLMSYDKKVMDKVKAARLANEKIYRWTDIPQTDRYTTEKVIPNKRSALHGRKNAVHLSVSTSYIYQYSSLLYLSMIK